MIYARTQEVHVITVSNQFNEALCNLIRNTVNLDYNLHVLGAGLPKLNAVHFQEEKPKLLLELLNLKNVNIHDDDLIVFVDGFDVLVQLSKTELLTKYQQIGSPEILFSGETYCFPWSLNGVVSTYCSSIMSKIEQPYGLMCNKKMKTWPWIKQDTCMIINENDNNQKLSHKIIFPFMNTGLYLAKKKSLIKLLELYMKVYIEKPMLHGYSDQAIIQDIFANNDKNDEIVDKYGSILFNICCPKQLLRKYTKWDSNQGLSFTLNNEKRVPVFIHWSGSSSKDDHMYNALANLHRNVSISKINNVIVHKNKYNVNQSKHTVQKCFN